MLNKPAVFAVRLAASCLLATGAHAQHSHGHAHVHGNATLQVAIEGSRVVMTLESPLDGIAGFEHAPRNDKERAALEAGMAKLRKPETLFVLSEKAGCVIASADASLPESRKTKSGEEEHAEATGKYEYRCERIDELRSIDVKLFDAFRGIRRVDAAVAGPRGQASARLTTGKRRIAW